MGQGNIGDAEAKGIELEVDGRLNYFSATAMSII